MENLQNEVWKEIEGFEDYEVSNLGRIKSFKCGKEKFLNKNNSPHFSVSLWKNRKHHKCLLYELVYTTFSGIQVGVDECIHHKNEDPTDNRFENLEKMTFSDHMKLHRKGSKLSFITRQKISQNHADLNGESNPLHKLTYEQVLEIKKMLLRNIKPKEVHIEFPEVSLSTIYDIKSGRSWSHTKLEEIN